MKYRVCGRWSFCIGLVVFTAIWLIGSVTAVGALDEVTFRLDWQIYGTHGPFFIAEKKGFYEAEGLKVNILEGTGSSEVVKIMGAKADTFAFASGSTALQGVTRGIPVKSVYMGMQKSPLAVIFLKKTGIRSPKDLIGKTVSTSGGGSGTALFNAFLRANEIDPSKVSVANLGQGGKERALLAGQVIGMLGYTVTEIPTIENAGFEADAILFADWGMNTVANGIIVNTETEKNPELIRRFLRAITKGFQYARANPDETVKYMTTRFPHKNSDVLRNELLWTFRLLESEATKGKPLGWQAESDWARTEDVLKKNGLIDKTMPLSNYFTNQYIQ
jgi:NitT/TauT family transport system substrate-binding protein